MRTAWILSPAQDLLLFVATPVLILPVILLLLQGIESNSIRTFVLAFGAAGHQLPGMLRAYGDRALFRRFKTRFILAPIVIGGLAAGFMLTGFTTPVTLVILLWAAWHALMQVYGFLRIYDAKVGAVAARMARLDFAMTLGWFTGAMVLSDARVYHLQELLVTFGVAPLDAATLADVRTVTIGVLGLITLSYVVGQVWQWRSGGGVNLVKHLLMFTAIGFWWYAHHFTNDVLLGLVMFEVFHDVQYLAIVWIFNRRSVDTNPKSGGFTRFVFRNSWGMIGIYIGLVFAYGGLIPLAKSFEPSLQVARGLEAFLVTSAILHYYFDGFIWKVREESTGSALGMSGGRQDRRVPTHGLKWLLFLAPIGLMAWLGEAKGDALERAQTLAKSTPDSQQAQLQLALEMNRKGQYLASLPVLERTIELLPTDRGALDLRARAWLFAGREKWFAGDREGGKPLIAKAYAYNPADVIFDCRLQAERSGDRRYLEVALAMEPDNAEIRALLEK